ncbi:MAG TPA: zinc-binding dehydrogenase, partial [Solirubrobacteraceae bacterium]|nr:zinc-binding dehydrogenase [Solirubrobacteraceae bacterium]
RRAVAARLAGAVVLAPGPDCVAEVREHCAGEGADIAVNATGVPGSFADAVAMVRDGGTVIEVGAFVDMGEETFNPATMCGRSLALLGVGGEDLTVYEGTLALLARHHASIPFAEMVSHRFAVGDAPAAMAVALDADASAKVLITPDVR